MRKLLAISAIAVLALSACGDDDGDSTTTTTEATTEAPGTTAATESTIADLLADSALSADLSTLLQAVQAAGLTETLAGEGPFTVFAPTNEAFAAIPEATLTALLADTETLTAILTYHVLPDEYTADEVVSAAGTEGVSVPTVQGESVDIAVTDGTVKVNDATVVTPDVTASNGVIHVIDKVLLPPGVTL